MLKVFPNVSTVLDQTGIPGELVLFTLALPSSLLCTVAQPPRAVGTIITQASSLYCIGVVLLPRRFAFCVMISSPGQFFLQDQHPFWVRHGPGRGSHSCMTVIHVQDRQLLF